jgi:plastocyanin
MKRLTFLCVVALLVAGCGGSSSKSDSSSTATSTGAASSGGGGGTQLALAADAAQLKFDKTQLSAKAGKVTITMTNGSPLQHDVALKGGVSQKGDVVGQDGKSVVTADLKPGQYTFYCSVDGHEAAGMTGTLTVK